MYAILRAKKIKNRDQITSAATHNFRLRTQRNVNKDRSHLNQILYNPLGIDTESAASCQEKLTAFYDEIGVKEKQNNVLLYEYVAAASPEFFREKSGEQIAKWAGDQIKFMRSEFDGQLKLAVLHLDEKSPHVHFFVSTEVKSVKKYKNRYGVSEKETWSLNSKRYDPDFLRGLQDRYALANNGWGLRRGVKGSKRKNVSLKRFYAMVDRVMNTTYKTQIDRMVNDIEITLGERLSIDTIRDKVREHLLPFLNGLVKQQKALKEVVKLDIYKLQVELIADQKQLRLEQEDILSMREVYGEAINGRLLDIQANQVLMEHNAILIGEIDRLRKKYEPESDGDSGLPPAIGAEDRLQPS